MSQFHVIIPARFDASRLPGKVLALLNGKPMVEHVHAIAQACGAQSVTVAADDQRIIDVCQTFGAKACLTRLSHRSGTDRIAECSQLLGLADNEIVVNLQGDEPLTPASLIRLAAETLQKKPAASVATLASIIDQASELHSPHAVKVVLDQQGYAMYFSRAPIPYDRNSFATGQLNLPGNMQPGNQASYLRHIGIYAYRAGFLKQITAKPPSPAEQAEQLEQLRAMHYGARIAVAIAEQPVAAGVDTPDDLVRVGQLLAARQSAGADEAGR